MDLAADLAAVIRRPGGDPAVRCLALLHGASCIGRFDAVACLHDLAAELGIEPVRIQETALQVVAYGGFPRAISGLALWAERRGGDAPGGAPGGLADGAAEDQAAAGRAVWDAVYARNAEDVIGSLETLAPGFSGWVLEAAYGRILARPGLTLEERELLAVAALALMALPAPLGSHARGALRNGSKPETVMDILDCCRVLADAGATPVLDQALDRLSRNVYRP
ncbi:MAG: carboxymuconolactone decarboxylase family protein [Planctomycetota bacterium]|jgi:4-carboxymuconolactone decarboxylase